MKRSPFPPRTKPIPHRSKPIRARRAKPRRSGRVRDADYMDWARENMPCAMAGSGCGGRLEADHVGQRPMGRKCSDTEIAILCSVHHRQRHDRAGVFAGMTREAERDWRVAQVVATASAWRLAHGQ